jgi:transcriptional antiterminator NusG
MLHPKDPYHTAHLPDHLQIGQSVSITAGPFEGFTGTVDAILADQGQVRVLVPVFNRTAPVAVDFAQVAALV